MKSRLGTMKDVVKDVVQEHMDKVTVKNVGILLGSAASAVAKPCLQLYDGVREGFHKKTPPPRD